MPPPGAVESRVGVNVALATEILVAWLVAVMDRAVAPVGVLVQE